VSLDETYPFPVYPSVKSFMYYYQLNVNPTNSFWGNMKDALQKQIIQRANQFVANPNTPIEPVKIITCNQHTNVISSTQKRLPKFNGTYDSANVIICVAGTLSPPNWFDCQFD
jgi:hypothetical protein